jgi:zinc transporter ZupT
MLVFILALCASCATFLGGYVMLKWRDHMHLAAGFSAGAVIGVAFFDLLPEAHNLLEGVVVRAYSHETLFAITALGFIVYLTLDRVLQLHNHSEHSDAHRGEAGAASLALHSFLDGIIIGLAFLASPSVGIVVVVAILAHDFADGVNTVQMVLHHGGKRKDAWRYLILDAAAPVLGVCAAQFISVSDATLAMLLALFAGFFLYIGASDLIPESHHAHPTLGTTLATVLGCVFLYVVVQMVQI